MFLVSNFDAFNARIIVCGLSRVSLVFRDVFACSDRLVAEASQDTHMVEDKGETNE